MDTDPLLRPTSGIGEGPHVDLLLAALVTEREAQRRLLDRDADGARPLFRAAAAAYRASFDAAPPAAWGRLIGALKAAVLAGDATREAETAREALNGLRDTPASCYLGALAATILMDGTTVRELAPGMRAGGDAFGRAADGLLAIVNDDPDGLDAITQAIDADFAGRDEHLTGVPIADTALMLRLLGERRGP